MASSPQTPAVDLDALIARVRAGDRRALETILATVAPAIHRFGLRMCRNVHDADDVLQDTLVNVVDHIAEFEGRSSLSSWVFALTRSACARKRRGLKNQPPVSDAHAPEMLDAAPSPETRAADRELQGALRNALDGLPDEQREVVLLRDVEGLSASEAASALGISESALKSRLHRAREALRAALRPILEPMNDHRRPTCPDISALWSQKLDGDLSRTDCSAMEKHIGECAACATACDALKDALVACQRIRSEEIPPEVRERVKSAVRAWSMPSS